MSSDTRYCYYYYFTTSLDTNNAEDDVLRFLLSYVHVHTYVLQRISRKKETGDSIPLMMNNHS